MSGALNNVHSNVVYALHLHSSEMLRLQEQASTGSRINRSSDDPSTGYRVLGLTSQGRTLQTYFDAISQSASTLEISTTVFENMVSAIEATKVDLTQIINGIYKPEGRERIAAAADNTLEQIVSLANTQRIGEYLFGGARTDTPPYAVERTNGEITRVTYQGSSEARDTEVAPGVKSSVFYAGEDIFRDDDRSTPVFFGNTGAKAGTGTSNVSGAVWLTVTHDGTNYKLSIDDGATEVTVPAVGDITNIPVTNSRSEVLYVDATDIDGTGVDMVSVPGTYDIFSVLISVREILKNDKGLSEARLVELRNNAVGCLEEVRSLLVGKSVVVGSRIGFLEDLKDTLESMKFDADDETALLQEADIAQVARDLSRREILYEMSLSVAGRLMSVSLLDFID
jgi:flagellar hook-associated protein 3